MFFYSLETARMDKSFLDGEAITGKAFLRSSEVASLREGDQILVKLSNGKKYKGIVIKFNYFLLNDREIGEITFMKHSR